MKEIQRKTLREIKLERAIEKFVNDFAHISWGYDGDCGSGLLVDCLEDSLEDQGDTERVKSPKSTVEASGLNHIEFINMISLVVGLILGLGLKGLGVI